MFSTGFEGLIMLLPCLRRDVKLWELPPRARFVSWGYVFRSDGEPPESWYILIALPSFSMERIDMGIGAPRWHRMHLLFRGELPSGEESWSTVKIPI